MRVNVDNPRCSCCHYGLGNIVVLRLTGVLEGKDYELFLPEIECVIAAHGAVRLLLELVKFRGWTNSAAWEDTRFGLKYWRDIERMAIVSDKHWIELATTLRPFSVRYFDASNFDAAMRWLNDDFVGEAPLGQNELEVHNDLV